MLINNPYLYLLILLPIAILCGEVYFTHISSLLDQNFYELEQLQITLIGTLKLLEFRDI